MRFYLPQAIMAWLVAIVFLDWRRIRELLVYGMAGIVVETVEDRIGTIMHWWQYRDAAPLDTHIKLSLVIALSAAPLLSMLFVQGLDRYDSGVPWVRIGIFTGIATIPELIAMHHGNIVYSGGWNMTYSTLAQIPTWVAFWGLFRMYNSGTGLRN